MTTLTVYPHPPFAPGVPTAADPPIAAPQAVPDSDYIKDRLFDSQLLTFPADPSQYVTTPITGTAASTVGLVITMTFGIYSEVAYQLGAFTPYYVAGSTINLTTGAYSLVRDHGFPVGNSVTVISAPAGGLGLKPIYTIDFTALPNQTMGAAGAYTVDGHVWYAKGTNAGPFGSNVTSSVVNGSGLELRQTAGGTGSDFNAGANDMQNRHLFFPFSSLPSTYNANAPLLVRWHMTGTDVPGNGSWPAAGLTNSTSDGVVLKAADRQYDNAVYPSGNLNGPNIKQALTVGGQFDVDTTTIYTSREFGVYRPMKDPTEVLCTLIGWSGSFGDVDTMRIATAAAGVPFKAARSNPGFIFAIVNQVNAVPVYVTHLQFLQPQV